MDLELDLVLIRSGVGSGDGSGVGSGVGSNARSNSSWEELFLNVEMKMKRRNLTTQNANM